MGNKNIPYMFLEGLFMHPNGWITVLEYVIQCNKHIS